MSIKDLKSQLFLRKHKPSAVSREKISIIGAGNVGTACAYSFLSQVSIFYSLELRKVFQVQRDVYFYFFNLRDFALS